MVRRFWLIAPYPARGDAAHDARHDGLRNAHRPPPQRGMPPVARAWAKDVDGEQKNILERTNVNGGAIAIGHPLGASGARIMTTLVNALEQRGGRYGLQTMCEGGGMANATIIERLGRTHSMRRDDLGVCRRWPR
jgi:acetyl-CoA acetyltransferase